jgi:MFS transporter, ACS family, pantothenate transporter
MMTLGFCNQIWIPLFTYPTVEAPRFPHGYPASTGFLVGMWSFLMFGTWYMPRWQKAHPEERVQEASQDPDQDETKDGQVTVIVDSSSDTSPPAHIK